MDRPVVTLTTIPPRFGKLAATLESLLTQRFRPARIQIYVPRRYRRFPDWDGRLPRVPKGVQIQRCERDYGPATKVLPAARAFRDHDRPLILCDDDRAYPTDWIERLVDAGKSRPDMAIALSGCDVKSITGTKSATNSAPRARKRARGTDIDFLVRRLLRRWQEGADATPPGRRAFGRSGLVDIFEGRAGVLLRPDFLDATAYAIPNIVWALDDVWLSGMLARRGVPIWVAANAREPEPTKAEGRASVVPHTPTLRAEANRAAIDFLQRTYDIWR